MPRRTIRVAPLQSDVRCIRCTVELGASFAKRVDSLVQRVAKSTSREVGIGGGKLATKYNSGQFRPLRIF